jgi:EAL domain-containing protein (putative c-di-GMP-specific phosphodiesterase class I)
VAVGASVLLVDDDLQLLDACRRALQRSGYRVLCAADGTEALKVALDESVDAIVSDISLPSMSGVELLCALRRTNPDVPVILTTGVPSLETAINALDQSANAYLTKPFDVAKLRTSLERALEQGQSRRRAARPDPAGVTARDLDMALDGLWVAFQPIYGAANRRVFGYEALMRSAHEPCRNPAVMLGLAERHERAWELGRAVRDRVAEQLCESSADAQIFVNVSPRELTDPHLYDPRSPLTAHASRVILEITERASLDRVEGVPERVERLRSLGFRIAIDDLGSGYSGLSALVLLEPEVVKIDMSLVRDVHQSSRKSALIRSLVQASKAFDALVVAEGIEVEEERAVLSELGCDLLQGYLLGRPSPWQQLVEAARGVGT